MKTTLLTKTTDYCREAQEFMKNLIPETNVYEGEVGDPLPPFDAGTEYVVSFLSPWIVPKQWLDQAKTSINFHPAPPEYPGIGCYNFAIYDGSRGYGATCHNMAEKVDTGKIIQVSRFPMDETDSVSSLKEKTMESLYRLFQEIAYKIASGEPLPESSERWAKKPHRRKDLQELCRITPDMSREEIARRIKATEFPEARDRPYIEIHGNKFYYGE